MSNDKKDKEKLNVGIFFIGKLDEVENIEKNHPWLFENFENINFNIYVSSWYEKDYRSNERNPLFGIAKGIFLHRRSKFQNFIKRQPSFFEFSKIHESQTDIPIEDAINRNFSQFYLFWKNFERLQDYNTDNDFFIRMRTDSITNHMNPNDFILEKCAPYFCPDTMYGEDNNFVKFFWKSFTEYSDTSKLKISIADQYYTHEKHGMVNDVLFGFNKHKIVDFDTPYFMENCIRIFNKIYNHKFDLNQTPKILESGEYMWWKLLQMNGSFIINGLGAPKIFK